MVTLTIPASPKKHVIGAWSFNQAIALIVIISHVLASIGLSFFGTWNLLQIAAVLAGGYCIVGIVTLTNLVVVGIPRAIASLA